jgi:CHAT domain-containing protein/tetratricopeptide (TPR) repeat protein
MFMLNRLIAATLILNLGPANLGSTNLGSTNSASPSIILNNPAKILAQAPTPTAEDKITEAVMLNNQAESLVYNGSAGIAELQEALSLFQRALEIFRKYDAKAGEANSLVNIGYIHSLQGNFTKALDFFQQSLDIRRKTRDRDNEWIPLSYTGEVYVNLGQYQKALEAYQPALNILRELKAKNPKEFNSPSEQQMLADIAAVYFRTGQYQKALEFYQQNLAIQKDNSKVSSAETLNNLGVVYVNLGDYAQGLNSYQQALSIVQELCYKEKSTCFYGTEAAILNNLAGIQFSLGQYQKALESAEKAGNIYRKFRDSKYQGNTQKDIKLLFDALGENAKALQTFTSRANVGDAYGKDSFQFQGEALNLINIGQINFSLGKYEQALKLYQQAFDIYKQNNYKQGIAVSLNNIARVYNYQRNYAQALELNQQALTIYREVGDRTGEGVTLSDLGQIYQKQNQYEKALGFYQQALAIHREVSDKVSEGGTLKYLGDVLSAQNQPQLAIAFYKQSVNNTEEIRQNLRVVSKDIQKSYSETVAERYRLLADLLLKQNRTAEAQQVLDLLQIQEAKEFIGNGHINPSSHSSRVSSRGSNSPQVAVQQPAKQTEKIALQPQEQEISQKYSSIQDKAIGLGKELGTLRKIPPNQRTSTQEKRIAELVKFEQEITAEFNKFIKSPSVMALVQQISASSGQENLSLRQLNAIRDNLRQLNQKALILYPLVLPDRLELVIVTADAPPIHRTVPVKKEELTEVISTFRRSLQTPGRDAKTPGNKLYNWLIKPIEKDLQQAGAEAIIYAPDSVLRYIPLAALYDGKNWLIEKFKINNITASSLIKFDSQPKKYQQVLAAAFTKGEYTVKFSNLEEKFSGLEYAGPEVENLAKTIPGTKILLDKDFNPQTIIPKMNDYQIVHLATHGLLVSGNPEDSFIIFGNGESVTLRDIENWSLPNVDLVVLSACQTGLGGKLGNGQEILGLGYQFQLTGAKASIASLWSVSDGGTKALMNNFYIALKSGNMTKLEALRRAQVALITGDYVVTNSGNPNTNTPSKQSKGSFRHPYYWAPFILIGNGF